MAAPVHLVSYFVSQVVLRKSLRGTWELKFWVRNSFLFWSSVRQSETEVASWRMLTNATNQLDFKAIACTRLLEEQENSSLQIPIDLILIFNLISRKSGVIFPGQSPNVTMAAANSLFCRLFFSLACQGRVSLKRSVAWHPDSSDWFILFHFSFIGRESHRLWSSITGDFIWESFQLQAASEYFAKFAGKELRE